MSRLSTAVADAGDELAFLHDAIEELLAAERFPDGDYAVTEIEIEVNVLEDWKKRCSARATGGRAGTRPCPPPNSVAEGRIEPRREPEVKDKEKLPAWLREAAMELEKAHGVLDEAGVPDAADDGTPISLALRIAYALDAAGVELEAGWES